MCRSRRTQKKYKRGKKKRGVKTEKKSQVDTRYRSAREESTIDERRGFKRGVKTEKKSQVDTRYVCVCVVCVRAQ